MQLTLNIPDFTPFALNKDVSEIVDTIKLNTSLMLFKNQKLSITQASTFSNLSIYDFIKECKKNKIAVVEYTKDELKNELELLDNI